MQPKDTQCTPCSLGGEALSQAAIAQAVSTLDGWAYDTDTSSLVKTWKFKNYYHTMAFVNAVAWIAHQQNHHPDLTVSYNRCVVRYQTHSVGGVTENDLLCAKLVEAI